MNPMETSRNTVHREPQAVVDGFEVLHDDDFNQALQIATDLLKLSCPSVFGCFYWRDQGTSYTVRAEFGSHPESTEDTQNRYSLSSSLINAVRHPIVLHRRQSPTAKKRLPRLVIPLPGRHQTLGIIAFWTNEASPDLNGCDRRLLDTIRTVVARLFNTLIENRKTIAATDTAAFLPCRDPGQTMPVDERRTKAVYRISEDKLEQARRELSGDIVQAGFQELEAFFEENYRPFTRLKGLEDITRQRLATIKSYLRDLVLRDMTLQIDKTIDQLKRQPLQPIMDHFVALTLDRCRQRRKRLEIVSEGGQFEVPLFRFRNLFGRLTHIIHNAVDHGIEPEETRLSQGKPPQGRLTIRARIDNEVMSLTFIDDGPGIDQASLGGSRLNRPPRQPKNDATPGRHCLVSIPQTAAHPGNGLYQVETAVNELDGQITIDSEAGRGTTVSVSVPLIWVDRLDISR